MYIPHSYTGWVHSVLRRNWGLWVVLRYITSDSLPILVSNVTSACPLYTRLVTRAPSDHVSFLVRSSSYGKRIVHRLILGIRFRYRASALRYAPRSSLHSPYAHTFNVPPHYLSLSPSFTPVSLVRLDSHILGLLRLWPLLSRILSYPLVAGPLLLFIWGCPFSGVTCRSGFSFRLLLSLTCSLCVLFGGIGIFSSLPSLFSFDPFKGPDIGSGPYLLGIRPSSFRMLLARPSS